MSVHEVGLSDLMDMARLSDTLPRRRALVGIQPAVHRLGDCLSPPVESAKAVAAGLALDLARRWRGRNSGSETAMRPGQRTGVTFVKLVTP